MAEGLSAKRTEPQRTRPHMVSDYGISTQDEGLMDWSWAEDQLGKSRNYWICSTQPDGKPHAAPVWGVWLDGALYFSSSRRALKARNLFANPEVVAHLESGDDVVILEGRIEEITNLAVLTHIAQVYGAKYPPFTPDPAEPSSVFFALRPQRALGWLEHDYPNTATRWTFDPV